MLEHTLDITFSFFMQYLINESFMSLSLVSKHMCENVKKFKRYNNIINPIRFDIGQFMHRFPQCIGVNLQGRDNLTNFQYLHNIQTLYIPYSNGLTNQHLKMLKQCRHLNVSFCQNVDSFVFKYLPKLETLNITGCQKITGDMLKYVPNLENLYISEHNQCVNANFQYVLKLKKLHLNMCNELTCDVFTYIPNLQSLFMIHCYKIQNFSMLKNLIFLDVRFCSFIEDTHLMALSNLQTLSLHGMNITGSCLSFLKDLRFLEIENCNYISASFEDINVKNISLSKNGLKLAF